MNFFPADASNDHDLEHLQEIPKKISFLKETSNFHFQIKQKLKLYYYEKRTYGNLVIHNCIIDSRLYTRYVHSTVHICNI